MPPYFGEILHLPHFSDLFFLVMLDLCVDDRAFARCVVVPACLGIALVNKLREKEVLRREGNKK